MDNVDDSAEIEANLYSSIHHDVLDKNEIDEIQSDSPKVQRDHDVIFYEKAEEKAIEKKYNPNSFIVAAGENSKSIIPSRFTPYTSYLSQINSKPIDLEIASIQQMEQKKKEATLITVSDSDGDDEICMLLEQPTVFNLVSTDEDEHSNFHDARAKLENHFTEPKKLPDDSETGSEVCMWVEEPTVIYVDSSDEDKDSNSRDGRAKLENHFAESNKLPDDSESGSEVCMWVEEPTVFNLDSSDEGENINSHTKAKLETNCMESYNLQNDSKDKNLSNDRRHVSRHDDNDDPLDVTGERNKTAAGKTAFNVSSATDLVDSVGKSERANRPFRKRVKTVCVPKSSELPEYSSDKGENSNSHTKATLETNTMESYERRDHHDDPLVVIDKAEQNKTAAGKTAFNFSSATDLVDNAATQHSLKRSYEVPEIDFTTTVVYDSESSDLPEYNVMDESQKAIPSEYTDIDIEERCQRTKKRKFSGSSRVSNDINSDDKADVDHEIIENAGHGAVSPPCYKETKKIRRYSDASLADYHITCDALEQTLVRSCLPADSGCLISNGSYENRTTCDVYQDDDYGVEKTTVSNIDEKEPDDAVDDDHDQYKTSEMNSLGELESFSFLNEMDKLLRSKFDLSFLTSTSVEEDQPNYQQIENKLVISKTKNKKEKVKVNRWAEIEISMLGYAKIFLNKKQARYLLSSEIGYKLLNDASTTHQVKIFMEWESDCNIVVVVGPKSNQNRFHANLIAFLEDKSRHDHMRKILPRKQIVLIRTIREQLDLLEQPLGNVNELFANMKKNECLATAKGTKKADRDRTNLNIILMGQAGLRDGKIHLYGLERNLRFLLEHDNCLITRKFLNQIHQHYSYIFSSYKHDNYPALISEYEKIMENKNLPTLKLDPTLLESNNSVNETIDCAKQQHVSSSDESGSTNNNRESIEHGVTVTEPNVLLTSEQKT